MRRRGDDPSPVSHVAWVLLGIGVASWAVAAPASVAQAQSPYTYNTFLNNSGISGTQQSTPQSAAPSQGAAATAQQLLRAAEGGDPAAQVKVAFALLQSQANPQLTPQQKAANLAGGVKWARAAADHGYAPGQNLLGVLYEFGMGVPANKPEAVRLYRLAAAQDDPGGQLDLGKAFLSGSGVPQDYAEARDLFQKAAEKNNLEAENYLGIMYAKGQGVPKDFATAVYWYRRAAAGGHGVAQFNLAINYANGSGVPQDNMLAYFWYNLAASRTIGNFQTMAARARDAMAQKLSPAEVERAQAVARDWKPGKGDAQSVEAELRRDLPASTATAAGGIAGGAGGQLRAMGSGFVVSNQGHVLTNAHVVNECARVSAQVLGQGEIAGQLVAKDVQNDLAVIKLATALPQVATFRERPGLRQGEAVVAYGYPLGNALAAQGNLTTGTVSALAGLNNDSRQLQISTPIQPGNSGGPLVDMSGNVVGVVVAKLNAIAMMRLTGDVPQNVNFAIKSGVAEDFLDANGVDYRQASSVQALAVPEVGARAKKFTLKIECWR